jgi:hypothetical protein
MALKVFHLEVCPMTVQKLSSKLDKTWIIKLSSWKIKKKIGRKSIGEMIDVG